MSGVVEFLVVVAVLGALTVVIAICRREILDYQDMVRRASAPLPVRAEQ